MLKKKTAKSKGKQAAIDNGPASGVAAH